jgi:glucose-1-phosphate cytidylyltransferase
MKHHTYHGFRDFVIALGYRGEYIKKYMIDYATLQRDITVSLRDGRVDRHGVDEEDWTVQLLDTGLKTQTGGRIKRLESCLRDGTFLLTWGDGVSDVDLSELIDFHRSHGKLATMTAVRPPARFGHLELDGARVAEFSEKPQTGEGWINGAFFVLEPEIFEYIESDSTHFEREPLENLAADGQLMAYRHESFWQCMDTLRDKRYLEQLWESGQAPWKLWSNV